MVVIGDKDPENLLGCQISSVMCNESPNKGGCSVAFVQAYPSSPCPLTHIGQYLVPWHCIVRECVNGMNVEKQ